jgi:glycosyltransferase involved in cell wall biosynthesis
MNVTENALVSVVIPAYNAERWLAEAVGSVLAQTYAPLEVVIVNDGSTDGTSALAHGIGDDRIRIVDKANGGVSSARNRGIREARGTYIAFLDADDAMLPRNLELKIGTLDRLGVDWVYSDMWQCDAGLHRIGEPERASDTDLINIILTASGIAVPGVSSNIVVHRRCLDAGIHFDEDLSNEADQDIILGLAHAHRYARVPEPLAMYRVLPGSMSRNMSLYEADHLRLFAKAERNGFLRDPSFRKRCMAGAYWAIGGSWWVNGGNVGRALPYILKAAALQPQLVARKMLKRLMNLRK